MSLSVVKPNLSLEKVAGPSTSYSENDVVLNKAMGKAETTNTAVYAHEEGSYFINNSGNLAKATSNIVIDDVLIAKPNDNYNYEITSVADEFESLGTASTKDSTTTISSGGGDLPTAGAVYSYIDTMITQALTASY